MCEIKGEEIKNKSGIRLEFYGFYYPDVVEQEKLREILKDLTGHRYRRLKNEWLERRFPGIKIESCKISSSEISNSNWP